MDGDDEYDVGADEGSPSKNEQTALIDSPKADSPKSGDDEKKEEDEKEEKERVPDLGGTSRLNKEYANKFSFLFYGAVILSLGNGLLWPVAYGWFFPEIITFLTEEGISVDENGEISWNLEDAAVQIVLPCIIIGVYALLVQTFQTYLFGIYGAKLSNLVKYDWFKAMLQQDINYHDAKKSSALNADLSVETEAIADGMGWKFGVLLQSIVQIIAGFGIGFYRSWR